MEQKTTNKNADQCPGSTCIDIGKAWLANKEMVKEHVGKFDLISLLEENGGLIRVNNFLPNEAAEAALNALIELESDRWTVRKNKDNAKRNTTQHKFHLAAPGETGDSLRQLTDIIQSLLPEKRSEFNAARYSKGHHISEHDDHALVYHEEEGDDGPVLCSRDIAVIYYLTKDWTERDGGVLVDLQTGAKYIPRFNSLVAFTVPRFHEVTAVRPRAGRLPRYSIFGWFLYEGNLYDFVPDEEGKRKSKKAKKGKNLLQKTDKKKKLAATTHAVNSSEPLTKKKKRLGKALQKDDHIQAMGPTYPSRKKARRDRRRKT